MSILMTAENWKNANWDREVFFIFFNIGKYFKIIANGDFF